MTITKVTLGTMTMNAGLGIPGSTIRWALKNQFQQFARVVVVDGDLTEEAKAFYAQFSNVEVIDSPWEDSYVRQYRAFTDKLNEGDYGLWLDDDEICSPQLLDKLESFPTLFSDRSLDIFQLPCVLHIDEDSKNFYPSEPYPGFVTTGTIGVYDKVPEQWTKNILFKKNEHLYFRHFGSHVIPMTNRGPTYTKYLGPFPYFHMKSLESFVYNDIWQAFLSPEGQGYSAVETALFKILTQQYKTTKDFKYATKHGMWLPPLKKFAWDRRHDYNRPISRLAWVYFILEGNAMPEKDDAMQWQNVKQYVQSPENMKIWNDNKNANKGILIDE
jgi:hypothetical protein